MKAIAARLVRLVTLGDLDAVMLATELPGHALGGAPHEGRCDQADAVAKSGGPVRALLVWTHGLSSAEPQFRRASRAALWSSCHGAD